MTSSSSSSSSSYFSVPYIDDQTKANFVRCCVKIRQKQHAPEMDMIGVILSAQEVVKHNVTNCYNKFTTIGDNSFKVVNSSHQDAEDIVLERDNELLLLKGELESVKAGLVEMLRVSEEKHVAFEKLRAADKDAAEELRVADKDAAEKLREADKDAAEEALAAMKLTFDELRAADKLTFDELRSELSAMKLAWDKSREADRLAIENKKAALMLIITSL